MTTEGAHRHFLAEYGRAWSAGDEEAFAEMLTADAHYVEAGMSASYSGRQEFLAFFRFMLKFSPDSTIEFTDFSHDESSFVAEWMWSGTVEGLLQVDDKFLDARGREYAVPGVALCRFGADGKIAYHKDFYDVRAFLHQLGLDGGGSTDTSRSSDR